MLTRVVGKNRGMAESGVRCEIDRGYEVPLEKIGGSKKRMTTFLEGLMVRVGDGMI
jgi:hypothetical protein